MILLWTFGVLHCFAEKATAHWHLQDSGRAHHHHHPIDGPTEHKHEEPVGGHSHDAEGSPCCEIKARIASPTPFEKIGADHLYLASICLLRNIREVQLPDFSIHYRKSGGFERNFNFDPNFQILTLRAPNAPPANSV